MKKLKLLAAIILVTILSGCASVKYAKLSQMPTAKKHMALVYFYRESKFAGGAMRYSIFEGEKKEEKRIGALPNGSFFYVYRKPGTYTFWAETEVVDSATLELESGKTYFIKGEIEMGFMVGRPNLTVVHSTEGKSEIPKLKYVMLTDKK